MWMCRGEYGVVVVVVWSRRNDVYVIIVCKVRLEVRFVVIVGEE